MSQILNNIVKTLKAEVRITLLNISKCSIIFSLILGISPVYAQTATQQSDPAFPVATQPSATQAPATTTQPATTSAPVVPGVVLDTEVTSEPVQAPAAQAPVEAPVAPSQQVAPQAAPPSVSLSEPAQSPAPSKEQSLVELLEEDMTLAESSTLYKNSLKADRWFKEKMVDRLEDADNFNETVGLTKLWTTIPLAVLIIYHGRKGVREITGAIDRIMPYERVAEFKKQDSVLSKEIAGKKSAINNLNLSPLELKKAEVELERLVDQRKELLRVRPNWFLRSGVKLSRAVTTSLWAVAGITAVIIVGDVLVIGFNRDVNEVVEEFKQDIDYIDQVLDDDKSTP